MAQQEQLSVRFWGVRGSTATPGEPWHRYGGNTACLEVRCGGNLMIFDGGTGLRQLGQHLAGEGPLDADLFFTHTHLDHVCGLPFFGPLYKKENRFRLWAGHLYPEPTLRAVLDHMMTPPLFPVPLEIFTAAMEFEDYQGGATLHPRPGVTLRTAPLNHPNGATGHRIEYDGKSICYITDTEHVRGAPDRNILGLIEGADIVIYDSTYTDDEFPQYVNWGHSTWQEGVRLCEAAGAKNLVIFHHDPDHDDDFMDTIAAAAERARPGTLVAREGMILKP